MELQGVFRFEMNGAGRRALSADHFHGLQLHRIAEQDIVVGGDGNIVHKGIAGQAVVLLCNQLIRLRMHREAATRSR